MSRRILYEAPRVAAAPGERVVTSTCGHNCGGRCVVNAHVRDERIVKISTDPRKWTPEMPPLHACVRGFGQMERVNHPDRLRHPLRRKGPRGAGEFERIAWDEALDEVARQMRRVRDTYGPAAILDCSRTGSLSMLHNARVTAQRLLHRFGGCTELWSNISAEAEVFAVHMTYGAKADYKSGGREPTDYVNSRLIVMWGWSPGDGTFGTGTLQYLRLAKRHGARIVCVDPRRTRTSRELADEHVFIRPSTDAAALIAMAYVIVTEGRHDQAFLDRHVLGFDAAHLPAGAPEGASHRSYLPGLADGVRKTPAWAAVITGMPAETIRRLALEYATTKPAALQCGYAPGRTANGEQFHRAAYALAAVTGSVGTPGGNSGVSNGATGRGGIRSLPPGPNPAGARVATPLLADPLERGRAGSGRATPSTTSTRSARRGSRACPRPMTRWRSRRRSATPSAIRSRRPRGRSRSTRWPSRRGRIRTVWGRSRRSRPGCRTRTMRAIRCGSSRRSRGRARTRSTTTSPSSCAPTATTFGSTPPTP